MIDSSTMLGTLMQSFPGISSLFYAITSLLGALMTVLAVLKIVEVNKFAGTPGGTRMVTPVMFFVVGAALWNMSSSVDTLLQTFFGDETSTKNLMSYSAASSASSQFKQMVTALMSVFGLIGYITIAKGWMMARKIGSGQNGSDEAVKGAVIRLIFGTLLVNIVATVNMVSETIGFGKVL